MGTLLLPSEMMQKDASKDEVIISVGQTDRTKLSSAVGTQLEGRPVLDVNVTVNGQMVEWNNRTAPVRVSLPYKPSQSEAANPNNLVVWSIDEKGNAVSVPNGRYDARTGTITFETTQFGTYAVSYVSKTFGDIEGHSWAKASIEALAARDVLKGTDADSFSPSRSVTRAEFVTMLVRALGLRAEIEGNFSDVADSEYYHNSIGIAKSLGIIHGKGNNTFAPNGNITRQDMFTMTARALNALSKLNNDDVGQDNDLAKFADHAQVADYAMKSMIEMVNAGIIQGDGAKLKPLSQATRAETAVMIFRILNQGTK